MGRCKQRGICACGAPECAEAEFWFRWGLLWALISFELAERDERRVARRDDHEWWNRIQMVSK